MTGKEPTRDPEIWEVFNFLLQGAVADLIKRAQAKLDRFMELLVQRAEHTSM